MKVEILINKYQGHIEHPELEIQDLGIKSLYIEGRGLPKRIQGRHAIIEGPESLVKSFLDKLAKTYDLHTDL